MSSFAKKAILQSPSPLLQFQRFRGKINIQKPRTPHYDRALFNAVTQPVYHRPSVVDQCSERQQTRALAKLNASTAAAAAAVENPYERIIAREVANWFAQSKLVAIFHINSISSEEMFKANVQLFKQNMHLKAYSRSILRQALETTKFASVLPLFDSKNCIVFSTKQKLPQLLKITKRIPQMVLLAGVCEDRLMSRTQLQDYAALPSLDIVRAQLVSVLQQSAGQLVVQQLQTHQQQLCAALDQHAAGGGGDEVAEKKVEGTTEKATEK